MRKNNLELWKYDESLSCLLFFAQRMEELLFHHTTDTYRYLSLSTRGLAAEFCSVYIDVSNNLIDKQNLSHIIDELASRLSNDDITKNILSKEFVDRFIKQYKSWDAKTQYENVRYIGRKLSNMSYYKHIVKNLKDLIIENRQKKSLDNLTSLFVREVLDSKMVKA